MIRPHGDRHRLSRRLILSALGGALVLAWTGDAFALETRISGRLMYGAAFRMEDPDPELMVAYNAAAVGLTGLANSGQNTDDANLNFRRGDATTRALRGFFDLALAEGAYSALLRVKAWQDFALTDHPRPWGNNANGYAAGRPLSDEGGARLTRFSGVALGDAYLQYAGKVSDAKLVTRFGQQALAWGERAAFAGGLSAVNPVDQPAMRRAGAAPQESRVPTPMLYARAELSPALAIDGFYTTTFRSSALDMCGTFWASVDYLAGGCDRAFAGAMAVNDRTRLQNGAFLKRSPSPLDDSGVQYGAGVTFKALSSEFGVYHARYINRLPMPGLRKSTRAGPAFIPGDPDGKNIVFFIGYPDDVSLTAATLVHRRGATTWSGELAYRPNQPLQLPPGDVLPAFLNPNAPSLLRADASAVAPGGAFFGFDRHKTAQLQFGVQQEWGKTGGVVLATSADVIGKHVIALPDQSVRRYGRPDQFGVGPIRGVCIVTSVNPARQCSFDGYVSANAWAYRLRIEAKVADLLQGLAVVASAQFTHDVKGWSHDFLLSEGRKTMNLGVRFDYRQRYLAEIVYAPIWGGLYNNQVDRDQLALAAGIRF